MTSVLAISLDAAGEASEPIWVAAGRARVTLWGTWTGTVTLQVLFPDHPGWVDVESFTYNQDLIIEEIDGANYRLAVLPGDSITGTVHGRIGQ